MVGFGWCRPDDRQWQLLTTMVTMTEFTNFTYFTAEFLMMNMKVLSPKVGKVRSRNGHVFVSMIYSYFSIVIYGSFFLCIEVRWICYFRDNCLSSTKENQMFLGNMKIIDISSTIT
jgi:hypothetical protein